jgi:hypothetical protein
LNTLRCAGIAGQVGALTVPSQLLEDLPQGAFAKLARATRCDLQPAAVALHEAGLLQESLDLLETAEVPDGRLPHRAPDRVLVHVLERGARVVAGHGSLQILVVVQPLERVDGGRQRLRVVAPAHRGLVPGQLRERPLQVRAQATHLEGQVHVLHDLLREGLQLRALLRRQRCDQPAHRRHAPRHLLQQLVQGLRVSGDQIAVTLHEALEVVGLSALAALDHVVEVGQHVAEP